MDITAQNLLTAGYKQYPDFLHNAKCIYQKTFRDATNNAKRFFVTFHAYDSWGFNSGTLVYEAFMQLNVIDCSTVNFQFLNPRSIEIVEEWAEKFFQLTGAINYE